MSGHKGAGEQNDIRRPLWGHQACEGKCPHVPLRRGANRGCSGGSNAKETSSVLLRHAPFVYVACSSVLSTTFHDISRIQLHVGAPRCEGRGGTTPGVWAICKNILLFLCFQLPLCMLLAPSSYQLHFTKAPLESSSMWVPRSARGERVQLPGCGQFERNCYCVAMFCSRCVLRLLLHPISYISQKHPLNPAPRWCPEV